MSTVITIDKDYGLVVLAASALAVEYWLTPLIWVAPVRKEVFNQQYLEKNFGQVHRLEVGAALPGNGYPDHGNGRYSQLLPYKDWLDLNNAYRIYQNFGEKVGFIIPLTLLGGLSHPRYAAGLGLGYILSRLIYGVGYAKHADKRYYGLTGISLTTLALGVLAAITGYKIYTSKAF